MKHINTFESFLSNSVDENIMPDQIEVVAKRLGYSMPNHTKPDKDGKFSAEQVQKAFKYIPELRYVKDKKSIQEIIDRALEIANAEPGTDFYKESENTNEGEKWVVWTQDPGEKKKKYGEYDKKQAFTALNNVGARYYDNETEVGIMKAEDWKKEGN